ASRPATFVALSRWDVVNTTTLSAIALEQGRASIPDPNLTPAFARRHLEEELRQFILVSKFRERTDTEVVI
ncbi:hypothetical protein, partial [Cohnella yongneupensis]